MSTDKHIWTASAPSPQISKNEMMREEIDRFCTETLEYLKPKDGDKNMKDFLRNQIREEQVCLDEVNERIRLKQEDIANINRLIQDLQNARQETTGRIRAFKMVLDKLLEAN